jgi:hypothetical protein
MGMEVGIHRLKEQLVGVRGQVKSCEAPLDVIGHVDHLFKLGVNSMIHEDMCLVVQPF